MIGKLRGRSTTELRDRLVQYGYSLSEQVGWLPTPRCPPAVSSVPNSPWPTLDTSAVRRGVPSDEQGALIARANRVVDGTFDVLGFDGLSYGSPIDWQRDPLAGRSAPRLHWSRVPYLDPGVVGDHKVTWEVNRHQWFVTLAQAFQLTGDVRYVLRADTLLRDWLSANPPKRGINWCSALELAFRIQAWVYGFRIFGNSAPLSLDLVQAVQMATVTHATHIERNLSTWFSPNTHLTGEALALLTVGCAWPALPGAARWRERGWAILCEQLPKQVRADGTYFEQSAWYQAYTVDFYVLAIAWARVAGFPVSAAMRERVRLAARALRLVTRPDGTIARLGDDDGGYTMRLSSRPHGDMTDTLWRAWSLLEDDAIVPPIEGGRSALLWLEGPPAFESAGAYTGHTRPGSVVLRDGGLCVLSEPGATPAADHWLILDAGPHGTAPYAHSHADALGIDLTVSGVPMLVDPGTGAYVGEPRTRLRSTGVHNTVTVDDRDSSEQWSSFKWTTAAEAAVTGFGVRPGAQWVAAVHSGYERLADPVRHHRTLLRLDRHFWLMFDTLDAAEPHTAALTLQGAHRADIANVGGRGSFVVRRDGVQLHVALDPALTAAVEHRTVSPAYGLELSAPAISARADIATRTTFCSLFAADAEAGPLVLATVEPSRAWTVSHRDGSDLLGAPRGRALQLGPAQFDGQVLVVLGADDAQTVVAAGAGSLHLAQHQVTLGADDIAIARRAADGSWMMER
jgi:Heparinase II/III-like protein/Heparinase II/III N-terminus